jgi:hypothetical protein
MNAVSNFMPPTGTFTYTYSGGGDLPQQVQFPGSGYIQNAYDSLARLTNTYLHSPLAGTIDQHGYAYDAGSEVTNQVFSAGNFLGYTYDAIGQLKSAQGVESPGHGSNVRLLEQFGYAYDKCYEPNCGRIFCRIVIVKTGEFGSVPS